MKALQAFPGHNSPGLIEAVLPALAPIRPQRPFPGHNSPGLIEAGTFWHIRGFARILFRGITAPASLKRRPVRSAQ